MVDRIEQEFAVEADRALAELKRLDDGMKGFQKTLRSLSRTVRTYNTNATNAVNVTRQLADSVPAVGAGLAKAGQGAEKLGRGVAKTRGLEANLRNAARSTQPLKRGLDDAAQSANNLTISFQTFSRIVATQLIVRALSQIRNRIRESVEQAIELQKQIALIGTIADGAPLQSIGESVREISDNFNLPIVETAVGLYNTLSNQVGDFGESLQFATEAAKFARATNSTLADSVDLLSGAQKAFGLTAADAGDLAGKFFVAIDKGRVTATEVANTLGRVLEPASAIGITFEELTAGIAEISVKGTSASESMTQFRGIINALTKPTDELSAALKEMGFNTTEAAVQALGLPGVLDALVKSTDGSAEALAKLFPRVRGIGGVFALTGENLENFNATLKETQEAGQALADTKFGEATATEAEKVTKALNRLNNVFTEDIGNLIVQRGSQLVDLAGGLKGIEEGAKIAVPALESLTLSIGVLIGALATAKVLAFVGAFTPLGAAAILVVGLTTAMIALNASIEEGRISRIEDRIAGASEVAEAEFKALREKNKNELDEEKKKNAEILSETQRRVAQTNLLLESPTDQAIRSNARLVADTKDGLDEIVRARKSLLSELSKVISDTAKNIQDSENIIRRIESRQEGREFQTSQRGRPEDVQIFRQISRSADDARDAQFEFNQAVRQGSEEGIKAARVALERAQSEGDSARSRAISLKDTGLIARAEQNLAEQSKRQADSERRLIRARKQRVGLARDERQAVREVNSEILKQAKIVQENTGSRRPDGTRFSEAELLRRGQKRAAALETIQQLAPQGLQAAERAGLTDLVKDVEDVLKNNPVELTLNIQEAQNQLLAAEFRIQAVVEFVNPRIEQLRSIFPERTIETADEIGKATKEAFELRQASLTREKQVTEEVQKQVGLRQRIGEAISLLGEEQAKRQQRVDNLVRGGLEVPEAIQLAADAPNKLAQGLRDVLSGGDPDEILEKLRDIFDTLNRNERPLNTTKNIFAAIARDAAAFLDATQKISDLQLNPQESDQLSRTEALTEPFAGAEQNLRQAQTPAELIEGALTRGGQALENGAAAITLAAPSIPPATRQFTGTVGLQRFANGGFTGTRRGTDTIPALLGARESVFSERATQRFFSQLQTFNAGGTPVSRSGDSNVTISTGDINITGAENPTATATELDRMYSRLQRRGQSLSFNKRRRRS